MFAEKNNEKKQITICICNACVFPFARSLLIGPRLLPLYSSYESFFGESLLFFDYESSVIAKFPIYHELMKWSDCNGIRLGIFHKSLNISVLRARPVYNEKMALHIVRKILIKSVNKIGHSLTRRGKCLDFYINSCIRPTTI